MAMNSTTLGAALAAAASGGNPAAIPASLANWTAIAAAIISHIQGNATIVGTATAVTAGAATAPVTAAIS